MCMRGPDIFSDCGTTYCTNRKGTLSRARRHCSVVHSDYTWPGPQNTDFDIAAPVESDRSARIGRTMQRTLTHGHWPFYDHLTFRVRTYGDAVDLLVKPFISEVDSINQTKAGVRCSVQHIMAQEAVVILRMGQRSCVERCKFEIHCMNGSNFSREAIRFVVVRAVSSSWYSNAVTIYIICRP